MMAASRPRMLRSIRARVTLGALLIVAIALVGGSFAAAQLLRTSLTDAVASALQQDLETLGDRAERGPIRLDDVDDDLLVRFDGPGGGVNEDEARSLPEVAEDHAAHVEVDGDPYLAASERTDRGLLTVARSLEGVEETVAATTGLLVVAVPLVVTLVGIVLWVVASRALAQVERLREQVDAIDATGLDRRVDAGRDDELGGLARTMNGMLDRIERAQTTQRQFVSDASHELRSPLATIRQHAEVALAHPGSTSLDALSRVVLDEGARMQELVEGLLLLARLDEGRGRASAPVDVDDLALAEARRLRGLGVAVDARGIGPGRVLGNEALLARALRNLVDNAVRHAGERVTIRVLPHGAWVLVQVEDDGDGIPPAQREHVFDRFARLDEARARDAGGSGLGLAIVREVALAHGGSVTVDSGAQGGALFTLALPSAPEA